MLGACLLAFVDRDGEFVDPVDRQAGAIMLGVALKKWLDTKG